MQNKDDLIKQMKVVDMMLTMHSVLAEKYKFRSDLLNILLLVASTVIVAGTFIDPSILQHFNINAELGKIIFGVSSISVFIITIISLVVDWKGKSNQHNEAFNMLIPLKSEWSEVIATLEDHDQNSINEFSRKSALMLGNLIPIPDSKFNKLKAIHYRKVEISKLISANPGSSVIVLKSILFLKCNTKSLFSIKGQ